MHMFNIRHFFSLSLAIAAVTALPFTKRAAPDVCNGRKELCDRKYSNVTFIGAHDSFAFSKNPLEVGRDQSISIADQLKLGVRLLQAQSHVDDGVLKFCHTSCALFDGGSVEDYLKTVKTFLDANPNEVLTLIFTNPEAQDVATVWKPIFDKTGITPLAFVPPKTPAAIGDWPTLGQMIESGKRVVVFLDANADGPNKVDFILPEFQMIWETPFSVTDDKFPCKVDRINGPLSTEDHMYMINHSLNAKILPFLDDVIVPDIVHIKQTNAIPSIMANVAGCAPLASNRNPNFLLMDFVDQGEAFKAADILNGFA